MAIERRSNAQAAQVIQTATRINVILGTENAWCYMRLRDVNPDVALRAISMDGERRAADQAAMRDAAVHKSFYWESECESMEGVARDAGSRRRDTITAQVVDRAIELAQLARRPEAEELLDEYGLATSAIMRILLEPDRRRAALWAIQARDAGS